MLDEENPREAARMPAVTARRLGRGLAVHVAADPFGEWWKWGHPTTWAFMKELLYRMQPEPWFTCDAPTSVEVSLRRRGDELLIHFIDINPGQDMSQTGVTNLHVYDIPALAPFQATVLCKQKPRSVVLEPCRKPLAADWDKGRLRLALPSLAIHYCVRIAGFFQGEGVR
jgi:hypothetical protein